MEENKEVDDYHSNIDLQASWNKLERDSKKVGFREGINNGRQEVYQKSFDVGYETGFRNGLLLGKYKALSRAQEIQDENFESHIELKETRKGNCEICKNNNLLDKKIVELVHIQSIKNNEVICNLDDWISKYKNEDISKNTN